MRYSTTALVEYIDSLMSTTETIQTIRRAGRERSQRILRRRFNGRAFDHDVDGRQWYRWRRGRKATTKGAERFLDRYGLKLADFEMWARTNKYPRTDRRKT